MYMSYIYKITNTLTNQAYIGKTTKTPEVRWEEHLQERKRERSKNRPFYCALNQYDSSVFKIETIEKIDTDDQSILSEREKYWIEYYDTFSNGYNATFGGDGKPYIDYNKVCQVYQEIQNIKETAILLKIDEGYAGKILEQCRIPKISREQALKKTNSIPVDMFDISGVFIKTFSSIHDAIREVLNKDIQCDVSGEVSHISSVCKGKRKSAYGYKWKYHNINQ